MSKNIDLKDNTSEINYSNTARIYSSEEEVFFDFGTSRLDGKDVSIEINNKIAMTYQSAKRLAINLGEHLRMHENRFGEIKIELPKEK